MYLFQKIPNQYIIDAFAVIFLILIVKIFRLAIFTHPINLILILVYVWSFSMEQQDDYNTR